MARDAHISQNGGRYSKRHAHGIDGIVQIEGINEIDENDQIHQNGRQVFKATWQVFKPHFDGKGTLFEALDSFPNRACSSCA